MALHPSLRVRNLALLYITEPTCHNSNEQVHVASPGMDERFATEIWSMHVSSNGHFTVCMHKQDKVVR